jgi:hypothetical protein
MDDGRYRPRHRIAIRATWILTFTVRRQDSRLELCRRFGSVIERSYAYPDRPLGHFINHREKDSIQWAS